MAVSTSAHTRFGHFVRMAYPWQSVCALTGTGLVWVPPGKVAVRPQASGSGATLVCLRAFARHGGGDSDCGRLGCDFSGCPTGGHGFWYRLPGTGASSARVNGNGSPHNGRVLCSVCVCVCVCVCVFHRLTGPLTAGKSTRKRVYGTNQSACVCVSRFQVPRRHHPTARCGAVPSPQLPVER